MNKKRLKVSIIYSLLFSSLRFLRPCSCCITILIQAWLCSGSGRNTFWEINSLLSELLLVKYLSVYDVRRVRLEDKLSVYKIHAELSASSRFGPVSTPQFGQHGVVGVIESIWYEIQGIRQDAFNPTPEAAVDVQYSVVICFFSNTGTCLGMIIFMTDNLI